MVNQKMIYGLFNLNCIAGLSSLIKKYTFFFKKINFSFFVYIPIKLITIIINANVPLQDYHNDADCL